MHREGARSGVEALHRDRAAAAVGVGGERRSLVAVGVVTGDLRLGRVRRGVRAAQRPHEPAPGGPLLRPRSAGPGDHGTTAGVRADLSSNGWKLWHATATTRAAALELAGSYPTDAADATHRESVRGPQPSNRSTGDEARKQLLETYAKRIADAVDSELGRLDPKGEAPLFLFATDPLLDLYRSAEKRRKIIHVPGGPDELKDFQIDEKIRGRLTGLNAGRTSARLEKIGNDLSAGLVLTDVSDIGRAAAAGAVDVLVYDFVVDILGRIDNTSGEVTYAGGDTSDAYDLLSRIGMLVLAGGGEVIAVRRDEVSADVWNGTAVAHLRYPLAG